MNKITVSIIGIVAVVALVLGVIIGHSFTRPTLGGASPVGTTNAAPRVAEQVTNNAASTTYASFYNGDASDRIITSVDFVLTQYGASSQFGSSLQAATTTTPSSLNGSTNYLINLSSISTTTDPVYLSISQTSGATSTIAGNLQRIWAAGTYLNFVANATTSGVGNIRVGYIPE